MNIVRGLVLAVALSVGWLGLLGCSSVDSFDASRALSGDDAIELQIRTALSEDPVTSRSVIPVSVRGGIVTLRGSVTEPSVRMRAESIARGTAGVLSVRNDIQQRY